MTINKKYPRFRIEFKSESNEYSIKYNTKYEATTELIDQRVLGFQSKNAMSDDAAVFSVILAGDVYWDKLLDVNDIMRIYIHPDITDKDRDERLVAIGMISQVSKQADYGNNQIVYKITGQSFAKPFMKFGLGVIQEIQTINSKTGWLPDGGETGIQFTGSNAKDITEAILKRFTPYMKYNFDNKLTKVTDFFSWELDSWTEYEKLSDPTPYTNFSGSLKQLIDDVSAKPFNETFFKNSTEKDNGVFVLRKTPFNPTKWTNLEYVTVSSKEVLSEDVGKSDVETYSIFTTVSPKMSSTPAPDVFSHPQFHQALIDRYGYTKMEVENRYINPLGQGSDSSDDEKDKKKKEEEQTRNGTQELSYSRLDTIFGNYTQDTASKNKKKLVGQITSTFKGVSKKQSTKAVDTFIKNNRYTKEDYKKQFKKDPDKDVEQDNRPKPTRDILKSDLKEIFKKEIKNKFEKVPSDTKKKAVDKLAKDYRYGNKEQATVFVNKYIKYKGKLKDKDYDMYINDAQDSQNNAIDTGTDVGDDALLIFSKMLFNWYHMNSNFYAGDISIVGNPAIDLGQRLFVVDEQDKNNWEFYIESVEHKYTYTEGYSTTVGVTRGLKEASIPEGSPFRFGGLWNKSTEFKGGLIGEMTMKEMKEQGYKDYQENMISNNGSDSGEDAGDATGGASLDSLKKYKGKLPKYNNKNYPGNPNPHGQCTWYVYNRRKQFGLAVSGWGDAYLYDQGARSAGLTVSNTPKQGAMVNWEAFTKGGPTKYGHVAFVESVSKDGKSFHISEYNWTPLSYGERTLRVSDYPKGTMHFIY